VHSPSGLEAEHKAIWLNLRTLNAMNDIGASGPDGHTPDEQVAVERAPEVPEGAREARLDFTGPDGSHVQLRVELPEVAGLAHVDDAQDIALSLRGHALLADGRIWQFQESHLSLGEAMYLGTWLDLSAAVPGLGLEGPLAFADPSIQVMCSYRGTGSVVIQLLLAHRCAPALHISGARRTLAAVEVQFDLTPTQLHDLVAPWNKALMNWVRQ
jgi:hypothetical protein